MRSIVALAYLLVAAAGGTAEEAPRRIALEQWQMARIRTGGIVECDTVVRNASADPLANVVVAAEFFGSDGKSLGRTPEWAVDTLGGIGKGRQGLIARLAPGAGEQVVIRALRIPVFETYRVKVTYTAAGRPAREAFEGSLASPPARPGMDLGPASRPTPPDGAAAGLRIVTQTWSSGPATRGKLRRYTLELRIHNASPLDALGLKANVEVTAAGVPLKTVKRSLEPPVLQAGGEGLYKVDCGELPPFDAHRVSVAFRTPPIAPAEEQLQEP